jgi:hypothetical protein
MIANPGRQLRFNKEALIEYAEMPAPIPTRATTAGDARSLPWRSGVRDRLRSGR